MEAPAYSRNLTPFSIKGLRIDPPLLLAPMAGITHLAFRQIVARYGGCGLYVSEMLSAKAVLHENPRHSFFLKRTAVERPFFYQLAGNDPDLIARAIRHLEQQNDADSLPVDGFDINMGCAAPPVRKSGCGVGLMKDPNLAARIVRACRRATDRPLTAKLRIGWEEALHETSRFALILQAEGIDAVTLHPRLAKEKFRRRARWEYVRMLRETVDIPVIGNGDIRSEQDAYMRLEETGCAGIMIGRLAAAQPWIFATTSGRCRAWAVDLRELYREFARLLRADCPAEKLIGRLREFTPYFAQNFRFGHRLASSVQNAGSFSIALEEADRFFEQNRDEVCLPLPTNGIGPETPRAPLQTDQAPPDSFLGR